MTHAAEANVYDSYKSADLEYGADGKVTGIGDSETANHQMKNQFFNAGTTNFNLNNDVKWLPEGNKGPTASLALWNAPLSELFNRGALTITDNTTGTPVTTLPDIEDWDLSEKTHTITWLKTDNTLGTVEVFGTDPNAQGETSLDNIKKQYTADALTGFTGPIVTSQPTQPFVDLKIASVSGNNSVLNLEGTDAIDWHPGQVKQSSLFTAENSGVINQNQAIKVTFDYSSSVTNLSAAQSNEGTFGAKKELSGATLTVRVNTDEYKQFTINTDAALNDYNNALIESIKNNITVATDYETQFNKAFKNTTSPEYSFVYDPTKVNYDSESYYFSPEMKEATGLRSILEAKNNGVVNINNSVEAIGSDTFQTAYNVYAHDNGIVNVSKDATITVQNRTTQNALVSSGSTFTNNGTIVFKNSTDEKNTNWADQVTGTGSNYNNNGTISIENSTANGSNIPDYLDGNPYYKYSRNIATEVLNGATATNNGTYNVGSTSGSNGGTATGVHLNQSGTVVNDGEINVVAITGGASSDNLDLNTTNNAISAFVSDDATKNVTINNTGTITIDKNAKNSAGINVAQTGSVPQNLTVDNSGTMNVDGANSAGIKVAGNFTTANNNQVKNSGTINVTGAKSSGIFAASGAEVANSGTINVTHDNASTAQDRVYGIKNDRSTVTLTSGSTLNVDGSYTTGLYARGGGQIIVDNGATINTVTRADTTNQVLFWVSGKGNDGTSSKIKFVETENHFDITNANSTLFRIDDGAKYEGGDSNLVVTVSGENSNGYSIANNGTSFSSGVSKIDVTGKNATGINVNSGAGLDGRVKLDADTAINVTGENATIAKVDGNTYDVDGSLKQKNTGAKLISEATLLAEGPHDSTGFKVVNNGQLDQNGTIDFSGAANSTGVYIDGGTLTNNGEIASNGIGVDVYQSSGNLVSKVTNNSDITATDGTAAIRLNKDASLTLSGTGTVVGENSADAIRVMAGSKELKTDGANIAVTGSGSGIHFLNTASDEPGATFRLTGSGIITVSGNDAAGITLEGQDSSGNPAMSNANLDTSGSEALVINVKDKGGNGIVTNTSGSVKSGTSLNIESDEGQSALVIKGTTTDIQQSGNLTSASKTSPVVDLNQINSSGEPINFTNTGKITSNGGTVAVDATQQAAAINMTNAGGQIKGGVELADKDNTVLLSGKSSTDYVKVGSGNNTFTVQDTSKVDDLTAGAGNNKFTVKGSAEAGTITAGDGNNYVSLEDTSKTQTLTLGNGENTVDIHGATQNGTLTSGSGNDTYNIIGATQVNSAALFAKIDAGTGTDTLNVKSNSYYQLSDADKITNFENLDIDDSSTFEVHNTNLKLNGDGATTNVVNLNQAGTYFINFDETADDYLLSQNIKGAGTIKTDTNGHAFDFGNADYTKDNFTGTLALGNGTFAVSGDNTKALTNATLKLDAKGIATVPADEGTQKIGGLTFNGGTLNYAKDFIGTKEDALNSNIEVKNLDVSKTGTVNVLTNGFDNDFNEDNTLKDVSKKTLLEQDDGINLVQLVNATDSVTGTAANIKFTMTDKSTSEQITTPTTDQEIRQDGDVVAMGTYGVGVSADDKGLYASYQLQKVAINDAKTLNLQTSADATGNAENFRAQITNAPNASGNVEINSNNNAITLLNSDNNYTGTTTVNTGTLNMGADRVLGQADQHTSALILNTGTQATFNNTTQYVGELNTATDSILALDTGTLNVADGGTVDGHITSDNAATLNVNGGELTVNGANQDYHGQTNIAANGTVSINDIQGLGDGNIDDAGVLNINSASGNLVNALSNNGVVNVAGTSDVVLSADNSQFSGDFNIDPTASLTAAEQKHLGDATINDDGKLVLADTSDWTIHNTIQGTGDVYKTGANIVELTNNSAQYTGATYVQNGSLVAGTETDSVALASSLVSIANGATFAGYGSVAGDVDNQGTFTVGGLNKEQLNTATNYLVNGNFSNAGKIILGSATGTGSKLNVNGNYISNGGSLYLNTVLNKGHAETETDQLVVNGNVLLGSGGSTAIYVKPVGGAGAYTKPNAIKVVDVSGTSDKGSFTLGSPVAMGIYEYKLYKGTQDDSWYLSSYNPVFPPEENEGESDNTFINPMVGAYLANQNALNMFNMTLHDRLGEPQYAESLKSSSSANSMWIRSTVNSSRYNVVNNQLKLNGDNQILQIGGDVINWGNWKNNGNNYRARVGIMGGMGQSNFDSTSRRTGTKANASIDNAYSVGIYGTIYQDSDRPLDSYVDAWALYNWYNGNKVSMTGYDTAKYDSQGFNVSLEIGHTFLAAESKDKTKQWQFQPQVQMTYGELSSDASGNDTGLHVNDSTTTSLESRVGGRMTYVNTSKINQIQPFVEVNWLRQYNDQGLTFNDGYRFNNAYPKDRYQVKLGFEGNTSKNWNGWGNISYTTGDQSYKEVKAMVGFKYQW
ncbi:autotransporter outer membrane beta-barrel domain-containing protein [Acinetobacter sp. MD2(2019)]|uniref:autotransporter outer membrane beta-barrel domain-containing protein n=1 Tax=Acinetobacter sp. MD2(2019) TaxID=2605273 RepID=UPI002D78AB51|nr:autotransporter outer membrane beta-barrel domain-containing protein [Acinetobacter sp. MD2(2019)]